MSLTASIYQCPRCMGYSSNPAICDHCKWIITKPFSVSSDIPICQKCKRESSDLSLGLCSYCIRKMGLNRNFNCETAFIPKEKVFSDTDKINPKHYRSHPSGIECIDVTRHHNFNIGNAIKYLWRQGLKDGSPAVEDLKKALWYIQDEIKRYEPSEKGNTLKEA